MAEPNRFALCGGWGTCLPTTDAMLPRSPSFYEGASLGLLDALSEGMHSMAQPLTVVRGNARSGFR